MKKLKKKSCAEEIVRSHLRRIINEGGAGSGNFGHSGGEGGPGNPGGSSGGGGGSGKGDSKSKVSAGKGKIPFTGREKRVMIQNLVQNRATKIFGKEPSPFDKDLWNTYIKLKDNISKSFTTNYERERKLFPQNPSSRLPVKDLLKAGKGVLNPKQFRNWKKVLDNEF